MSFRDLKGRIFSAFDEVIRITSMRLILYPVAYALPRKLALWIANVLALLLVLSPKSGKNTYSQMSQGFGKGLRSLDLTYKWLRRPFRDFVILTRIINQREDPSKWRIIEKNPEAIKALRESGESYIVASGHFSREALISLFDPRITFGHPIHVAIDVPERIQSLYDRRICIRLGALLRTANYLEKKVEILFVGKCPFKELLRRLRNQGNVLFIHVDAPWHANRPGSFLRPFAGHQSRAFATGAVRLAKLAKCPVVSCVYRLGKDGTKIIEWGTPYFPQESDDDINITNRLLDHLETAIGERPAQYILEVGGDRRWNSPNKCWENVVTAKIENE